MPNNVITISPLRWRRQVMRSMSGRLRGAGSLEGGRRSLAVVGQEDLLEAALVAGEVDDLAPIDRPHKRCEGAVDGAANSLAMYLDVVHARRRANSLHRGLRGELDLHLVNPAVVQDR